MHDVAPVVDMEVNKPYQNRGVGPNQKVVISKVDNWCGCVSQDELALSAQGGRVAEICQGPRLKLMGISG